jgi:hypothetical protein
MFNGVTRDGRVVALCRDGIACLRRKMAADGIRLLPHPKNPPGFALVPPPQSPGSVREGEA